jgi:hypothetical protein
VLTVPSPRHDLVEVPLESFLAAVYDAARRNVGRGGIIRVVRKDGATTSRARAPNAPMLVGVGFFGSQRRTLTATAATWRAMK